MVAGSGSTVERVAAGTADEGVVVVATVQRVGTTGTFEPVRQGVAGDVIAAAAAGDVLDRVAHAADVVAVGVVRQAVQCHGHSGAAVEQRGVGPRRAVEDVRPESTVERVRTTGAVEILGGPAPDEGVVADAADDVLDTGPDVVVLAGRAVVGVAVVDGHGNVLGRLTVVVDGVHPGATVQRVAAVVALERGSAGSGCQRVIRRRHPWSVTGFAPPVRLSTPPPVRMTSMSAPTLSPSDTTAGEGSMSLSPSFAPAPTVTV